MLIYVASWAVVDTLVSNDIYGVLNSVFKTGYFHLGNLLAITATSFIDYFFELIDKWTYEMQR